MIWQNLSHQNLSPNELSPHGRAQRIELTGSDRAIARWSVRHVAKICFELRYIENPAPSLHSSSSGGELRALRRRTHLTSPRWPAAHPPTQHDYAVLIVGERKDSVPVVGQRTGHPGLVGVEFLRAVLLNLETNVHSAEELNGLLDVGVIRSMRA